MNPVFQHASTPLEPGITVIAASAGTGKTFTLAALVVRLVAEHDVPIQRLLLTTYTVAATAELRDRIRVRLISALSAIKAGVPPDDEFLAELLPILPDTAAERLEAAIRDFDEATIHTIHGFCQRALRELAFETGTPFDPELLTDTTALFTETTQDYWRAHVYSAPPIVAASLSSTELSAAALVGPLRALAGRPNAKVIPEASTLPAARAELLALHVEFKSQWPGWRNTVEHLLVTGNTWGKSGYYDEELRPKLAMLEAAAREDATGAALVDACKTFCFLTAECIRKNTNKTKCKTAIEHPLFTFCTRFAAARQRLHEATIAHFLTWSRKALEEQKSARGFLLFDDLLIRLHNALGTAEHQSTAAVQLGARYDAILVDEFQDTDSIQADIFLRVFGAGKHRLFLIGDPKQAIYGFRGADVFAYLNAVSHATRQYTLQQNQRSSTAMVGAVNALFSRPSDPFADLRIPFEPVDAAGRADKTPLRVAGAARAPFNFWYWKSDQRISRTVLKRALPEIVAWEVTRFLQSEATIGDRPVLPGDCAVLCRDNRQAREVADLLADNGVPAVVLSNANVFESEEAAELRLILASLDDPGREALLRSALATIALGCTMADLIDLENTPTKWESIRQRWQAHHARWRELGFIRMFREFLRIEGIRSRLLAHRDGERHLTNLQHLAELTHAAAEAQHLGPSGVLHWLDQQMQPGAAGDETELRLDRDDSAVRIITVHKSKGLEYPVVFCPYLWGDATIRDDGPLCFHDASGQTVYDLREARDPEYERRAQDEEFAEQTRLLYVALTRAKYECHVVWGPIGNGNKREKDPEISALLRLLEPPPGPATFATLANHAAAACSPARLEATVAALCEISPALFCRRDLPVAGTPRFDSREETANPLAARIFRGKIDSTWRSTSYTALNAGIDYDAEAVNRRLIAPELLRGIHAFPRGIKAGSCLHDILQHADFSATAEQRADFLTRKLRQHAMGSPENVAAVEALLAEITAVLPAEALSPATSLRELEFHLPAALLTPAALQAFAEGAALTFDRQRGILTGIIDLVYQREGRFYVLDWKSNWLGADTSAYHAASLETQMSRHRYGLQRQLYLFALHRFLGTRVHGYNPATHLGGALYVFLRGLARGNPEIGIVSSAADASSLEKLESLFRVE